jgi:ubiquinol-cytochrome c reductase cytochrome c1 subunit
MRRLAVLAAAIGLSLALGAAPAFAQDEAPTPPKQDWSFSGPFKGLDVAAAQRGFQVYNEVCSACHSMGLVHWRDLSGIGFSEAQIKALASDKSATPNDPLKPFPDDPAAAAASFGGALPPDQSLLVNARPDGSNYIYALIALGYVDAPKGITVADGLYYNTYFAGHQIHMPPPLSADQVTYADGTKATLEQEAHDVVTFLTWASNPEMVERKQMGWRMVIYFGLMACLTYALKKRIWAKVH